MSSSKSGFKCDVLLLCPAVILAFVFPAAAPPCLRAPHLPPAHLPETVLHKVSLNRQGFSTPSEWGTSEQYTRLQQAYVYWSMSLSLACSENPYRPIYISETSREPISQRSAILDCQGWRRCRNQRIHLRDMSEKDRSASGQCWTEAQSRRFVPSRGCESLRPLLPYRWMLNIHVC